MERTQTYRFDWSPEYIEYLTELYKTHTIRQISEIIGLSHATVRNRFHQLGIRCPEQNRGGFTKGIVPHNKGSKMSNEMREKIAHTWFKKGNLPHNTRKGDGLIFSDRSDKNGTLYRHVKIDHGKWQYYHRYIWEQANGKIPPKHNLIFLNGDKFDFRLENLKLLSNKELMSKNSIRNYPKAVAELLLLNAKLKRTLNEIGKK